MKLYTLNENVSERVTASLRSKPNDQMWAQLTPEIVNLDTMVNMDVLLWLQLSNKLIVQLYTGTK